MSAATPARYPAPTDAIGLEPARRRLRHAHAAISGPSPASDPAHDRAELSPDQRADRAAVGWGSAAAQPATPPAPGSVLGKAFQNSASLPLPRRQGSRRM